MNNPYRNGKEMSPGMTVLAMVYEAGVRAALAEVHNRWNALEGSERNIEEVLVEISHELPPPAPKQEETTDG